MSRIIVIPTLSDHGWAQELKTQADLLLVYFFEADGIQSYLYSSKVKSIQSIRSKNSMNVDLLVTEIQEALHEYYQSHFDSVDVTTELVTAPDRSPDSNEKAIAIRIFIQSNGEQITLNSLINYEGSKFNIIRKFFNEGVLE